MESALTLEAMLPAGRSLHQYVLDLAETGREVPDTMVATWGLELAQRTFAFQSLLQERAAQVRSQVCCPAGCGADMDLATQACAHPLAGEDIALSYVLDDGLDGLTEHRNGMPVDRIVADFADWLSRAPRCGSGMCMRDEHLLAVAAEAVGEYAAMSYEMQVQEASEGLLSLVAEEAWEQARARHPEVEDADLLDLLDRSKLEAAVVVPEHLVGSGWDEAADGFASLDLASLADHLELPPRQVARALTALTAWLCTPREQ